MVDDDGGKFEEGINGQYKLDGGAFLYQKKKAIEDYTMQIVWDGNKWVFRMFLVVGGEIGAVEEITLKDFDGNSYTDKCIVPTHPGKGSVKRANGDIMHVLIMEDCDNIGPPSGGVPQNNLIPNSLLLPN
jgi:hypothetical protein